jgi:hypothetical protein
MFTFRPSHLPTHGSGPLYQWYLILTLGKKRRAIRFSSGGYGYVAAPHGSWRWYPNYKGYRHTCHYFSWLHFSLSYLPNYTG